MQMTNNKSTATSTSTIPNGYTRIRFVNGGGIVRIPTPHPKVGIVNGPITPIKGVHYRDHPEAAMEWRPPSSPFHRKPLFVNNFSRHAARVLFPETRKRTFSDTISTSN